MKPSWDYGLDVKKKYNLFNVHQHTPTTLDKILQHLQNGPFYQSVRVSCGFVLDGYWKVRKITCT